MRASTVPSSREANKALLRRYKTGILNDRDVDALGEVAVADYLDHAAFPGQAPGLEGLKQRASILWQALDPHWTIDDVIRDRRGEAVAERNPVWGVGTRAGEPRLPLVDGATCRVGESRRLPTPSRRNRGVLERNRVVL
jgi:hypothetical protein